MNNIQITASMIAEIENWLVIIKERKFSDFSRKISTYRQQIILSQIACLEYQQPVLALFSDNYAFYEYCFVFA